LSTLKEGQLIQGVVKNITDYGAFIDLGGIDGLLHITDMSWGRVGHPSEMFNIGDKVEVSVLKYDRETGRISLGLKQKSADPWTGVATKYAIGTHIEGKVKSLTDFGAFIGLEEGIDGLIHISDMSWTKHIKHPSELFKKGQKVEAVVLRIDKEKERLSLGYKQLKGDPWDDEIPTRYAVADVAVGKVSKVADFGIFVELAGGVEGLIHISEAGLDPQAKLEEKFKLQDEVTAKIIKVDREERKIALSLRDHQMDSDRRTVDEYHAAQGALDQSLGRAAKQNRKRGQDEDEK